MRHVIQPGLALIGGLAVSTSLFAEVSANVALTTDYIFRGISQSDEHPAIQVGFDYTHDAGVFAGVWGSTVDFDDGGQASMELDYYVGYGANIKAWSMSSATPITIIPARAVPIMIIRSWGPNSPTSGSVGD